MKNNHFATLQLFNWLHLWLLPPPPKSAYVFSWCLLPPFSLFLHLRSSLCQVSQSLAQTVINAKKHATRAEKGGISSSK